MLLYDCYILRAIFLPDTVWPRLHIAIYWFRMMVIWSYGPLLIIWSADRMTKSSPPYWQPMIPTNQMKKPTPKMYCMMYKYIQEICWMMYNYIHIVCLLYFLIFFVAASAIHIPRREIGTTQITHWFGWWSYDHMVRWS